MLPKKAMQLPFPQTIYAINYIHETFLRNFECHSSTNDLGNYHLGVFLPKFSGKKYSKLLEKSK